MIKKAIVIDDLSIVLGKKIFAIKNLDLDLPEGKIIGFIGPSGAGKTTLIRSIVGLQKITNGEITIFGFPAGAAKLRKKISYMTQETSVYPDLTVYQNVDYFATMYGIKKSDRQHQVEVIIKTLDLTKQANRIVRNLSGGQKQRVSLAIALIGSPRILVLDEPTVGLDPLLRNQIWRLFKELASKGKTIIISSHVMEEAERCDELLLLRDGMLLAKGSPEELRTRTNTTTVEQSFLKLVGDRQ